MIEEPAAPVEIPQAFDRTIVKAIKDLTEQELITISLIFVTPRGHVFYREFLSTRTKQMSKRFMFNTTFRAGKFSRGILRRIHRIINFCTWRKPKYLQQLLVHDEKKRKRFIFVVMCHNTDSRRHYNGIMSSDIGFYDKNYTSLNYHFIFNNILGYLSLDFPKTYATIQLRRRRRALHAFLNCARRYNEKDAFKITREKKRIARKH